jgi:ABC-type Fe3+/spermidine/putrescine transport system ATPase subunit
MADRIVVMNEARIQQIADPLTIATRPATELVARFMGDNNIIRGKVTAVDGNRLTVEDEQHVRASVVAPGANRRSARRPPRHSPNTSARSTG